MAIITDIPTKTVLPIVNTGIDRQRMFEKLKVALFDKLNQLQVDGINAVLDECMRQGVTDKRMIAYICATCYHEGYDFKSGIRFVPIPEGGGEIYLKSKPYYPFYGRGYVQLTWERNYKKYSKLMNIDFIAHPERLLEIKIAAFIIVHGMKFGVYTGKKLSDFIGLKCDFVGARTIVNGKDKANLIASHANGFLTALS